MPTRDRRLIFAAVVVRSFASGFQSILLGLYLAGAGLDAVHIGAVLTAALAGTALLTLLVGLLADTLGRRLVLFLLALLTAVGGVAFALVPLFPVLLIVSLLGAINTTGKDRGHVAALEQAVLPDTCPPGQRTQTFALYNILSSLAAAAGALFAGAPALLQRWAGLQALPSYQAMFLLYALLAALVGASYLGLSPAVEARPTAPRPRLFSTVRSVRVVGGLAALFAVDAFGGGFIVQSMLAYWFHVRFGLSPEALGVLFFGTGVMNSLSFLVAARLADRIGLLNTMVFTHLPSNLLLMAIAVAPTVWVALVFLLLREGLSQMDVPTRQSYTMAVVRPEERTAASSVTTLARSMAQAVSPSIAGSLIQAAALGAPFVIGGALKVVYDVVLFLTFRRVRPPEEAMRKAPPSAQE